MVIVVILKYKRRTGYCLHDSSSTQSGVLCKLGLLRADKFEFQGWVQQQVDTVSAHGITFRDAKQADTAAGYFRVH